MDKMMEYRQILKRLLTRYAELINRRAQPGEETAAVFDEEQGHYSALSNTFLDDRPITTEDGFIRDTFNVFFEYLSRFNSYCASSSLVKYDDFHPYLSYWLDLLTNKDNNRKPPEYIDTISFYLETYQYKAVKQLFRRYQSKAGIQITQ